MSRKVTRSDATLTPYVAIGHYLAAYRAIGEELKKVMAQGHAYYRAIGPKEMRRRLSPRIRILRAF